jgi:hypothetical protein
MGLFNFKRNKETQRFYLLPGQGGAAASSATSSNGLS